MKKMIKFILLIISISVVVSNPYSQESNKISESKRTSLKPISICCDIPELGEVKHLNECSNPKLQGPCDDIQCVFDKSGFLIDNQTLNKEVYRNHLHQWTESNKIWSEAVEKAIKDCVDKDPRQYLYHPCKTYDVFTCTSIAMLKKCPKEAWKC